MENTVEEGMKILKRLSPKNQAYFMTMLRLAEVAEDGAKNEMQNQLSETKKIMEQKGRVNL